MSESDGKDWMMLESGVAEQSREKERDGWVKAVLPTVMSEYENGPIPTMADAVATGMRRAWSAGYAVARSATEGEVNEASRVAFAAARRKTLADAIVLRRGVPGGSDWEGARYDADGEAASTVGHADPMVVLAAVLGKDAPRPSEAEAIEQARKDAAEEVELRHVDALRNLCHHLCESAKDANTSTFAGCVALLAFSLDRRARRIEELTAEVLFPPQVYREDANEAYARGLADGAARALTRVEAEADGYRRRAQAIRVEAEVAEAKADALAGVVTQIRREGAP